MQGGTWRNIYERGLRPEDVENNNIKDFSSRFKTHREGSLAFIAKREGDNLRGKLNLKSLARRRRVLQIRDCVIWPSN